jgi:short-subunit dehydrogenase
VSSSNLVSGKVLVTGASGGLGHAIARAFASRGAGLILTGRRADVLDALAHQVSGRVIVCDLSIADDVTRLAEEAGEVDVLVANAGLPASGLLEDLTQTQIDRMIDVNLRAPIALARALAPGMIGRRRGHMVFISSLSGKAASAAPASSIYSATKFGLRGFALGLREDLRPHGVGASVVLPGFVRDAGMFVDAAAELPRIAGTSSPKEVAAGVIRAVERNRGEIDIGPLLMRVGANFAGLAPALASAISRRMGSEQVGAAFAEGQREKR